MSLNGDRNIDKKSKKRRYTEGTTSIADWASASPTIIRDVIAAVAKDGSAIRFGYSRDGGAFAIGLYEGGESYTVWCKPGEDIDAKLQDILEAFT